MHTSRRGLPPDDERRYIAHDSSVSPPHTSTAQHSTAQHLCRHDAVGIVRTIPLRVFSALSPPSEMDLDKASSTTTSYGNTNANSNNSSNNSNSNNRPIPPPVPPPPQRRLLVDGGGGMDKRRSSSWWSAGDGSNCQRRR